MHHGYHTAMRAILGLPRPPTACDGLPPLLLGLALAGGCSDDGLVNQSSGLAPTSTTGGPVDDSGESVGEGPPATTADPDTGPLPPSDSTTADHEMASDGDTTGGQVATGTETGSGSGSETDGTTGGPNQACADGCAVEFMCGTEWASAEDCVAWCEANLMKANAFSPFCRAAWEGVSACLGTLTCEEFAQWENPMMFPYPCSEADVALSVECKGQ
jgi:hypothetical protein